MLGVIVSSNYSPVSWGPMTIVSGEREALLAIAKGRAAIVESMRKLS